MCVKFDTLQRDSDAIGQSLYLAIFFIKMLASWAAVAAKGKVVIDAPTEVVTVSKMRDDGAY